MATWGERGLEFEVLTPWRRCLNGLANPWRNYLLPKALLQWVVRRSKSPLIQETLRKPGGWQSMAIIYANPAPNGLLDGWAVQHSPLAMATRNRRKLITARLEELLRAIPDHEVLTAVGIGAGPGVHLRDALRSCGRRPDQFRVYLIDRDMSACQEIERNAAELSWHDSWRFIHGDARSIRDLLPCVQPHLVKMVGLIEYLSDGELKELLAALRSVMRPGARLLTHGLVDRYGNSPFLERTFGLRHHRRTGPELAGLLTESGFKDIRCWETPMRIFPVCLATRDEVVPQKDRCQAELLQSPGLVDVSRTPRVARGPQHGR